MRVHDNLSQVRPEAINQSHQSDQRQEKVPGAPVCVRCGKPMKLVCQFQHTETRQIWHCARCYGF